MALMYESSQQKNSENTKLILKIEEWSKRRLVNMKKNRYGIKYSHKGLTNFTGLSNPRVS